MNILYLTGYFFPEKIAFSHLEQDIIEVLLERGHTVDVLCPVPTRGITKEQAEEFGKRRTESLYEGRVRVRRFWAPQEGRNPLLRAFRYLWCNLCQFFIGKRYRDIDVVFAVSTPPTQGFLAGAVGKCLKRPVVYNVQDVFPDSLVTTGMTREGSLLWKIGRNIENSTYKKVAKILVIGYSMKNNLMAKNVPEEKILVIPNWIDTECVKPVDKKENRLYDELEIDPGKFTVVYAGNFGAAQGANIVLEAAKLLPEVQFVIFGGGSEFGAIKENAEELPNVIANGLLPVERVPEVYSLGDVCLITCKKGVGGSGIPSKTWSIMACGTPIVAAFDTDSELADIIRESNAGVCIEPEEPEALAQAICSMKENSAQYCGGRDYVCTNASKLVCAVKYAEAMECLR